MNILVVAPQPFYEERGTPIATRRLVNCLVAMGHSVDLLTYPLGREATQTRASVHRSAPLPGISHVPVGPSWPKVALDVPLTLKLFRMARPGVYDVVHAVEEAVFPALFFGGRHRAKVVYDMDSSLAQQLLDSHALFRTLWRPIRGFERWALRRADLVLAVCDDLAEQARQAGGPANRIRVVRDVPLESEPSGEPVDDLRAVWPAGTFVALYVGNLVSYQGIDLLLDSTEFLDPAARISVTVIGGSGENVRTFRERAAERGLADRIRFLGRRPVGDLPAYLAQADALLSPRIRGGNTPLKIYSYMASGKPIVATNLKSHTQVLDDGTALLFEPDPRSLAAALEELAADPDAGGRLGGAAREVVDRLYSMESYQRDLESAYALLQDH